MNLINRHWNNLNFYTYIVVNCSQFLTLWKSKLKRKLKSSRLKTLTAIYFCPLDNFEILIYSLRNTNYLRCLRSCVFSPNVKHENGCDEEQGHNKNRNWSPIEKKNYLIKFIN